MTCNTCSSDKPEVRGSVAKEDGQPFPCNDPFHSASAASPVPAGTSSTDGKAKPSRKAKASS